MIALEEAIIRVPIGEAARGGVSLITEDVYVLLIHLNRGINYQWASAFSS